MPFLSGPRFVFPYRQRTRTYQERNWIKKKEVFTSKRVRSHSHRTLSHKTKPVAVFQEDLSACQELQFIWAKRSKFSMKMSLDTSKLAYLFIKHLQKLLFHPAGWIFIHWITFVLHHSSDQSAAVILYHSWKLAASIRGKSCCTNHFIFHLQLLNFLFLTLQEFFGRSACFLLLLPAWCWHFLQLQAVCLVVFRWRCFIFLNQCVMDRTAVRDRGCHELPAGSHRG